METGDPKHPNKAGDIKGIFEDIRRENEEKTVLYNAETIRLLAGITDPLEHSKIAFRKNPLMQGLMVRTFTVAGRQAQELHDLALKMETKKLQISSKHSDAVFQLQADVFDNRFVISLPVTPNTRSLAKQTLSLFETLLRSKSSGRQISISINSNEESIHLIVDLDDFFNLDYLNNLFDDFVGLCSGHKEVTDIDAGVNDAGAKLDYILVEVTKLRTAILEHSTPSVKIDGGVSGVVNIQQNYGGSNILNSTNTNNTEIAEMFSQLREAISRIPDTNARSAIQLSVIEMEQAHNSSDFWKKYQAFIDKAANHMTLFEPIIQTLTKMLP